MSFQTGQVVGQRYVLEEVIATGGMGQVWRAQDQTLGREVAIKVLRPDTAENDGFVRRFRAEARHAAALAHPNIGTVHDFGESEHEAYLVMELLEGQALSAVIRERAPLPPAEVTEILYQAAIALQAAHDAGLVHRDVKPANIVVDSQGYAKLTDFGIARALQGAHLTQTGEVLGTPHYLSPEQAQGQPATAASDIYALAVVGYEMLTGQRPFSGESMVTTALAHVSQPAPQLPDSVPEPLRTTVMSGLAKRPEHRPRTAADFAEALRLPAGHTPPHLVAGAASAVAPLVVGSGATLPPSAAPDTPVDVPTVGFGPHPGSAAPRAEATSVLPVHTPSTPMPGAVLAGQRPLTPMPGAVLAGRRRSVPLWQRPWPLRWPLVLPLVAAAVLAIGLVVALAGRGQDQEQPSVGGPTGTPAPTATAAPTSAATSSPTTTRAPTVSEPAAPVAGPGTGGGKGRPAEPGAGKRKEDRKP